MQRCSAFHLWHLPGYAQPDRESVARFYDPQPRRFCSDRALDEDDPMRVDAAACQAARQQLVRQPLRGKRRNSVRDRIADGPTIAERAIEPDREGTRGAITDRAVHADDTIDLAAEGPRLRAAVAGVENEDAHVVRCSVHHHGEGST